MTELRFFWDLASQPCRAVCLFLEENKIPYKPVHLDLAKDYRYGLCVAFANGKVWVGSDNQAQSLNDTRSEHFQWKLCEHKTSKELGKVTPFRALPVMDDNGFCLTESGAILRYLVAKYKVPDHWYPSKLEDRARVDECLDWTDANFHAGAGGYFYYKFVAPMVFGLPEDPAKVEESKGKLDKAIDSLENYFLTRGKFIGGDDISIADLKPLCELTQLWMTGFQPYEAGSKVDVWIKNCKERLGSHFDKAHIVVTGAIEKGVLMPKN